VTLGGDRSLANPTGAVNGQSYVLRVKQDATGGHALAWGSKYLFSGNSIPSTVPDSLSIATFVCDGANFYNTGGYNLSGAMPFSFTDQTGVGVGVVVTSDSVVLERIPGSPASVLASVSGQGNPQLSVNGGGWAPSVQVSAGNTLQVRATSAATVSTTTYVHVVVGGFTTRWSMTTTTNPTSFNFANVTGKPWSTVVESDVQNPGGYTGSLPVSVSGDGTPELTVDGGATWAAATRIAPGQSLKVHLTTPAASNTLSSATVTVGSYTTTWTVRTTIDPSTWPTFAARTGIAWNTLTAPTSPAASVTVSGHTAALPMSVTGDGSPQISTNGSTWVTSGTFPASTGSLYVRLTSANASSTTYTASITIGNTTKSWSVTTTSDPTTWPAFTNVTGKTWSTLTVPSPAYVTVSGNAAALSMGVTGDGSPQISLNNSTWVTAGTFPASSGTLYIRLTSAGASSTTNTATVTIGNTSKTWSVTTTSDPTTWPAFTNVTGRGWNVLTTPSPTYVTISGNAASLSMSVAGDGGPQISLNNSTWVTSGTFPASSSPLYIRLTSANAPGATNTATVTIGNTSKTWSVTTTGDSSPFTFSDKSGQGWNTVVASDPVVPGGFTETLPVTVSGDGSPKISINNGTFATSGTITAGQNLKVQLTSASGTTTTRTATVTIGNYTVPAWSVTTTVDPTFTFADQTGKEVNKLITSAAVTPGTYTGAVPVSVSGDGSPKISIAGGAWVTSGTLAPGNTLAVQLTTAGTANTTRQATVAAGGSFTTTWRVTTASCTSGSQTFSTVGTSSFTVPAGCSPVAVKLWGGGGGAGGSTSTAKASGAGGGGGFAQASVTTTGGETLTVEVGGGGNGGSTSGSTGGSGGTGGGGTGGKADTSGSDGGPEEEEEARAASCAAEARSSRLPAEAEQAAAGTRPAAPRLRPPEVQAARAAAAAPPEARLLAAAAAARAAAGAAAEAAGAAAEAPARATTKTPAPAARVAPA